MDIQQPIQHALASFSAFVPARKTVELGRVGEQEAARGGDKIEYVRGEFGDRRQVFADYYREPVGPHLQFANTGDTVEEIIRFTSEWGPLRPNHKGEFLLRTAFGGDVSPENYFAFYTEPWRQSRREFAQAIQLVEKDNIKGLRKLLPYQHQGQRPCREGALYSYLETGTPIEILEELWTADGRMTEMEARETAERAGIFVEYEGGPKHRIVFEAVSLMDAFWHMLLLDLTVRRQRARICVNPSQRYLKF
jgi:hypothetical protein